MDPQLSKGRKPSEALYNPCMSPRSAYKGPLSLGNPHFAALTVQRLTAAETRQPSPHIGNLKGCIEGYIGMGQGFRVPGDV